MTAKRRGPELCVDPETRELPFAASCSSGQLPESGGQDLLRVDAELLSLRSHTRARDPDTAPRMSDSAYEAIIQTYRRCVAYTY